MDLFNLAAGVKIPLVRNWALAFIFTDKDPFPLPHCCATSDHLGVVSVVQTGGRRVHKFPVK